MFNRTAVDAAQLVVLTGRRYDPLLGHGGGVGALYPAFCDRATRAEASLRLSLEAPGGRPSAALVEATEAAWLLGVPFFVQVLPGTGDTLAQILAGPASALAEGQRRLDALWRRVLPRQADVVVASLSGDPARHSFADLASAVACAARAVRPEGKIVLLSGAAPPPDPSSTLLRTSGSPEDAVREYSRRHDLDLVPAWQWAAAAARGSLLILSELDNVDTLFAAPLESIEQVQEIVSRAESCLVLPDAHKTLAVVEANS
jgi:nickel-dependent lactate racemase